MYKDYPETIYMDQNHEQGVSNLIKILISIFPILLYIRKLMVIKYMLPWT
ncbi:hypothetical protein BACSP_04295 [Bacillus sp. T2.9-1]|nr:hypothetical protein BACSP_04295 [Bacillus sp. T2.9-1]